MPRSLGPSGTTKRRPPRERRRRGRNLAALEHHENGEVATWQHKNSGVTARSQLGGPKHSGETARPRTRSQLGSTSNPEKRRGRNLATEPLRRSGDVATWQHRHSRETVRSRSQLESTSTPEKRRTASSQLAKQALHLQNVPQQSISKTFPPDPHLHLYS